jgi:hypothetical protein
MPHKFPLWRLGVIVTGLAIAKPNLSKIPGDPRKSRFEERAASRIGSFYRSLPGRIEP